MSEPLTPELEAKAQKLAAKIQTQSATAVLEMARKLVTTTEETLFGDTEFVLRDQALGIVANAYACHIPKKVDTSPPPPTAPIAKARPTSTTTTPKPSSRSAGPSPAVEPTTTAEPAALDRAPGTTASD